MVFNYKTPWINVEEKIVLYKKKYYNTNKLAVTAVTIYGEPYATFTTCLNSPLSSDDNSLALIDVNNNPGLDNWLKKNNIATPTGYRGYSGFCCYPEYKFNLKLLMDSEENG